MNITKLIINNYKSFYEETILEFSPGFNVIIGKNNSGKTALTEILSTKFVDIPHSSKATSPQFGISNLDHDSTATFVFEIQQKDFRTILSNRNHRISVPRTDANKDQIIKQDIEKALESEKLSVETGFRNGNLLSPYLTIRGNVHSADSYHFDQNSFKFNALGGFSTQHDIANILSRHFQSRVYYYRAERFHVGQSNIGPSNTLTPDASNLPEVLTNLKSGKYRIFLTILNMFK